MPVLIITPDMSAETWMGATGWARGSQTWSGIRPALVPNPTSEQDEDAGRAPSAAALRRRPAERGEVERARRRAASIANATRMAAVARWVMAR